ncbi:MAG: SAM-dependent methyltransferase [Actinomycetales bacterium]|nr:SAM-dependent methyltransferase [Actinomycetales bacterium]
MSVSTEANGGMRLERGMRCPVSSPPEDSVRANPARVYDAWLGGKNHYAVDRIVADRIAAVTPFVVAGARANRAFLRRAVTYLVRIGVDQFIDVGSGLPTVRNVHEVARRVNPTARVAYVDLDPVVLAHARALLATDEHTIVVEGDARNPRAILTDPALTAHLDLSRPVAVLFVAVLHFLTDTDDPGAVVDAFRRAMAPGSHVVISHVTPGEPGQESGMAQAVGLCASGAAPFTPRTRAQVRQLFTGFELVDPGVVPAQRWRPHGPQARTVLPIIAGVGRLHGAGATPPRRGISSRRRCTVTDPPT